MSDIRKIKQLQSQLSKMIDGLEVLKLEVANKQRELSLKQHAIQDLKEKIDSLDNNNNIKISEHAILRYLERVKNIDLTEIQNEILTSDVLSLIEKLGGSGKYPNKDFQVVMKDYTVTTII